MSMVFCRGCGKEIHETAVACPSCGAPQGIPTAPETGNWYQKILSSYSKSPYSKYIKGFFTFLIGSSSALVELGETDHYSLLKIDKVTKPIAHAFHCFDGIVNTLNDAGCETVSEVI